MEVEDTIIESVGSGVCGQISSRKLCTPAKENAAVDDDDFDHRPQRRRYEEPLPVKIRKQLLSIAESVLSLLHRCEYWG